MRPDTFRSALRAAAALTGIAACAAPNSPAPSPPKPEPCPAITDAAFGVEDPYPGRPTGPVDPAAVRCCDAAIRTVSANNTAPGGDADNAKVYAYMRHRWACCAVTTVTNYYPGSMCIPWGPPVPPPMKRREQVA